MSALPDWVVVGFEPRDLNNVERNRPKLAKHMQRFTMLQILAQPTSNNPWDKLSTVAGFIDQRLKRGAPDIPGTLLKLLSLLE